MISQTISHYRIIEKLGAGGMGEVYKAQDTVLDRPVALKILPLELVEDADRVRRFIQEARSASALNHPHIVTIYEIGQIPANAPTASQTHYIAMEFIDGVTLHTKIHNERIELKKLLEFLAQAADGLAKAHAAGIVHRDLKPENIMITLDNYAKILDFGLAKLTEVKEPADEESASDEFKEADTAVMQKTKPGIVMGTVGYMSPEQAQGKPVDHRSDIFSFGCILYEAATGRRPFEGDSLIDSLHKIIYSQAPLVKEFNPGAPAELQRIIKKCLAKDPSERYQSIKDLAIDLRELIREYETQPLVSGPHSQSPGSTALSQAKITDPNSRSVITGENSQGPATAEQGVVSVQTSSPVRQHKMGRWIAAGSLFLLIMAASLIYIFISPKEPNRESSLSFRNTRITKLTSTGKIRGAVISPDGKYVVHVVSEAGQQSLWVRQVATSSNVQIIEPAEISYVGLTFSLDGNYIYYAKEEKDKNIRTLYQLPVLGGVSKKILDDVDSSISFSPDGKQFVFLRVAPSKGEVALIIANTDGTGERVLVVNKQPNILVEPVWSPDGRRIACVAASLTGGSHMEVAELLVADGKQKLLTSQRWRLISSLRWLSDGSGLILSAVDPNFGSNQSQIWQVSYPDGKARKITNDLNNYNGVSLSADSSSLVTVQTEAISNLWIAPDGDSRSAKQITSGSSKSDQACWTPDGKVVYISDASGNSDIWIMDADGKNQKQLTAQAGANFFPSVSPDGRFIVFCSTRSSNTTAVSLWRMDIDGSNPKQLTRGESDFWPACSPDGRWVFFTPISSKKPTTWKVSIDGGEPVEVNDRLTMIPLVSPDGKLIASWYFDEQADSRTKLAIFPADGGPPTKAFDIKVRNYQAGQFRWAADGKALFYIDSRGGVMNIWSQPLDGSPPKQLTNFDRDLIFSFDWSRDGKQLACARGVTTTDAILIREIKQEQER